MPKQKTKGVAKKRFVLKKSGIIKRAKQGRRHLLSHRSSANKRNLRQGGYVSKTQEKTIKLMVKG